MQGLRPYVQDENALAGLHRPAAVKAAPLGGEATLGAGLGGLAARKAAPGVPHVVARKALGNITNRGGFDPENVAPGKTPAGAAPVRRALGDITNSAAPAPGSARPGLAQKPALQQLQQQAAAQQTAVLPADARLNDLAAGGVERLAGRGWDALERDRLAREDAEIQDRLSAIANFSARALPNFYPLWARPSTTLTMKKDVLPTLPASPTKQSFAGTSSGPLSVVDLGDLSLALPDIACPDIDDAMDAFGQDGF